MCRVTRHLSPATRHTVVSDLTILHAAVTALIWLVVLAQDLRHRRVSIGVLVALTIAGLIGHAWPWCIAAGAALLWPKRDTALLLGVPAVALGVVTNTLAPAIALAGGAFAWALGWWSGADAIALLALGLRAGLPGLIGGSLAVALVGAWVMLVRKRRLISIVPALTEAMFLRKREDADIPAEAEMPAAAALAAAGLVLEITHMAS